jgi:hypothetical protein
LSIYENHAKRVLYGDADFEYLDNGDYFLRADYQKFKLFQISLIWRMAISRLDEFSEVSINVRDINRLREMIVSESPGLSYEYACTLIRPHYPKINLKQAVGCFPSGYINGIEVAQLNCGGFVWIFWITRKKYINETVLNEMGQLPIHNDSGILGKRYLEILAQAINSKGY